MILQALTKLYEDLADKGKTSRLGWSEGKVSYALRIDDNGKLIDIMLLTSEEERNGKKLLLPKKMVIPAPVKRSSGISPNFLCDNSSYILGIGDTNKKNRTIQCFLACRNLHNEVLKDVNSCAAKALLSFFNNWDPEKEEESLVLAHYKEDIIKDANITFWYGDSFIFEDSLIMDAWNKQYQKSNDEDTEMVCLVTGEKGKVEAIHPSIKGIRGAQTAGAALVSFNADAFESYSKKQNYNAPVSSYATFAYTTALNYLIADRDNVNYIGDTAVLLWAEGAEVGFRSLANMCLFGAKDNYSTKDIMEKMKRIASGKKIEFDETMIDPDRKFYVLGIAPNAARLSIRFFWCNTFGKFIKNIEEHYKRLEIVKPENEQYEDLPIWKILKETVRENPNSKNTMASPNMSGQLLQSILSDYRYPATLLNSINIRIRADRKINRCRAAIIKAYYLKNKNVEIPEEVLKVALNTETKNIPYNLGRLFAVLENIQQKANPGINTTIRDKYLNSASSTPAVVFPILLNLSQKHLNKIPVGLQVALSKEMQDIMDKFDEEFPKRLNLAQQGSFQLGYYHQTQARYQSKSKED
ncbi:MAG: type I-C CRISPR-associated protein Cas8c/Csd1 [Lachnospiraceae bacterium]|nr:type I-C CRISPR-associated protein Cas8c/Csd1 [Lachnospiraceae bacterium]